VTLACAALTVVSHFLSPGNPWSHWSLFDRFLGLFGLVVSTILVLKNQASEIVLQRSEAFLSQAQRLSRTGSFGWDVPREAHFWSDESYRIYGYDPATTTPTLGLMLARAHPEDRALVERTIDQAFNDGAGFDFEHRLLMPDGATRYVHLVARATGDRTGKVEFVGALMDVTAAKRSFDELQQTQADLARISRLTSMGQLAASIAHEVNQPLTGVVTNGYTCLHWLNENTLDLDKARVTAQRVVRDGERASDVVRRIQRLMTKAPPQTTNVDINGVITEVLALTQTELRTRDVVVHTELTPTLPPVLGDPVQLQQVLLNLVINGIDAMAPVTDRPKILVIGSRLDASGAGLVFVRDHGTGLDDEAADRIFDPFYTTKSKGTGMGLTICRSIIEAHDGRLWASPATPHGAMFQFTVPTKATEYP